MSKAYRYREAYYDGKSLMRSGVFKSKTDMINYLLIKSIQETDQPVGSWALKSVLDSYGLVYSTASVGRYLRELDDKELTVQRGNQGRVLTPIGSAYLAETDARIRRARMRDMVSDALKVNEYYELIDLLYMRKAIESQAALQAALQADEEDLRQLEQSVKNHRECVARNHDPTDPALEFHSVVAHISHNKFAAALLDMLIFEEKQIESVFLTLVTRELGSMYVEDHEEIALAISERRPDEAEALMSRHIQELVDAIQRQAEENEDMV